jgi:hypothetical protein
MMHGTCCNIDQCPLDKTHFLCLFKLFCMNSNPIIKSGAETNKIKTQTGACSLNGMRGMNGVSEVIKVNGISEVIRVNGVNGESNVGGVNGESGVKLVRGVTSSTPLRSWVPLKSWTLNAA